MHFAIDRYIGGHNGQEIEVSAEDIFEQYRGGYIPHRNDRFYCPECQEKVFFRQHGGQKPDMFYHQNKTATSPECDKRVDGRSDLYLYERTGLPTYIILQHGNVYKLFIGFPAAGEEIIRKASAMGSVVEIFGERIPVSCSSFYFDSVTLLPIKKIPMDGKNIPISIIPSNYILQRKWSNYSDGFSVNGAVFSITSNGGKKVKRGDSISLKKEYLIVSQNFKPYYSEIQSQRIGSVYINEIDYSVFSVTINCSVDSPVFSRINDYMHRLFDVWIIEKEASMIPIWPPTINQNGYLSVSTSRYIYCSVESGNEKPKVFSYKSNQATEEKVYFDKYNNRSIRVPISQLETMLSVDRKYTGREIGLRKGNIPTPKSFPSIVLHSGEKEINFGNRISSYDIKNGIYCTTNVKGKIVVKSRTNVYHEISVDREQVSFNVIPGISEIVVEVSNSYLTPIVIEDKSHSFLIDEAELIKKIRKCRSGALIAAPRGVRNFIEICNRQHYYKLQQFIASLIRNGKIDSSAAASILQLRRYWTNG